METPDVRILLHDIRSKENVGAIFRTAESIGISMVYLSGYTPGPIDRFGFQDSKIAKSAVGAEKLVFSMRVDEPKTLFQSLKKEGFSIVGIEQSRGSIDYKKYLPTQKILLMVGNEVLGLDHTLQGYCDVVVEIPMRGKKESLNVSVAFGIVVFRLLDRL